MINLFRNYGAPNTTSPDPLPSIYPNALATNGNFGEWNFASWTPDALVINLGTNDFSTTPNPTQTEFVTGRNFIEIFNFSQLILIFFFSFPNVFYYEISLKNII